MSLHKIAASAIHLYYYNSLSAEKEESCIPKKVTLKSVTEFKYDLFYLYYFVLAVRLKNIFITSQRRLKIVLPRTV